MDTEIPGIPYNICPRNGIYRPPRQNEPSKAFMHRIYETLRTIAMAEDVPREMRIIKIHPTPDWARVWENLHDTWASDNKKAIWYKVIHDIQPTNERLHTKKLSDTAQCRECGDKDTIMHRLTDCGTGNAIWA